MERTRSEEKTGGAVDGERVTRQNVDKLHYHNSLSQISITNVFADRTERQRVAKGNVALRQACRTKYIRGS